MSDVIPVANPTLLRAQATAGQAGADAFKEASAILAEQQKSAASMAMAEAQRRGAPASAAMSVPNDLNTMYAQRIASMTDQGGVAQAQQESRVGRMADYNAAVNASRGLIADQTAQTVAPINAETDFRIRSLEREGQNAVDKINAQMRLDAARAAYSAASRGGGGGGGGGGKDKEKMNATELRSMLTNRGSENIQKAMGKAQQAVRQTGEMQRQAASYAGRAAQDYRQSQPKSREEIAKQEALRQAIAYTGRASQQRPARFVPTTMPPQIEPTTFRPGTSPVDWGRQNAEQRRLAGSYSARARSDALPRSLREMSAPLPGRSQADVLARLIAEQRQAVAAPRADALKMGTAAARRAAPLYVDDSANMLTEKQLSEFEASPLSPLYDAMLNGQPVRNTYGVEESLGGVPRADGSVDPDAQAAMRQAMILAALGLTEEGYDITEPEMLAALDEDGSYKIGSTWADIQGRGAGAGSIADQQEAAIAAQEKANQQATAAGREGDRQQSAEDAEFEAGINQEFARRTQGLDAKKYNVAPEELFSVINDPQFEGYLALAEGAADREEIVKILTDNGLSQSQNRLTIQIIADMLDV